MTPGVRDFIHSFPYKGVFIVVVAAWVALFHFLGNSVFGYTDTSSLFRWLWAIWNGSADDEIGMLVPALVLGLFYLKRHELLAAIQNPWAPALLFLGAGIFLHIVGFTVQQTRISALGFFCGLFGLLGMVWGPRFLRASFFPFFLLIFAIPFSTLLEPISIPLRHLVTRIAVGFCNAILNIGVLRDGVLLFSENRSFQFQVAPACSGINSLTAMFLLTVTYAFLRLRTPWKRAVLILGSIPLAILGNVIRLITVVWVADLFGQNAGGAIETKFGFLTFLSGLAGVFALGWLLREGGSGSPIQTNKPEPRPALQV